MLYNLYNSYFVNFVIWGFWLLRIFIFIYIYITRVGLIMTFIMMFIMTFIMSSIMTYRGARHGAPAAACRSASALRWKPFGEPCGKPLPDECV